MASFIGFSVDPIQVAAAATTYYTSDNCRTRLDKVTLTNTTGSNRTVTIYKVPVGGSAGASNTVALTKTVLAGQAIDVTELEGHWLNSGDFVRAVADVAAAVTLMISVIKTSI